MSKIFIASAFGARLTTYPMKKLPEKRLTPEISQVEVVTLAVYQLGGAQRAIDTEDIAVEAHRIAPGRFSWKKYRDQINLELIRVDLSDAKKDANKLLIGSGRTGWRLTQRGLHWAEQFTKTVGELDASRSRAQSRAGSIDEQRWHRERSRIIGTRAWHLWTTGVRDIPTVEAKQVFRIDSYARGELFEAKITRVRALFSADPELAPFLDHLIHHLNRKTTS
jgi:hypothetical protein